MQKWITQGKASDTFPVIHVVSDSVGTTAQTLVRAASSCFEVYDPAIEILPRVESCNSMVEDLEAHLAKHLELGRIPFVLFYTLIRADLRSCMEEFLRTHLEEVIGVDLMSNALCALIRATGREPLQEPGRLHSVNEYYFRRIDAMEFTISHDDGRNRKTFVKPISYLSECRDPLKRRCRFTSRNWAIAWPMCRSTPKANRQKKSSKLIQHAYSDSLSRLKFLQTYVSGASEMPATWLPHMQIWSVSTKIWSAQGL